MLRAGSPEKNITSRPARKLAQALSISRTACARRELAAPCLQDALSAQTGSKIATRSHLSIPPSKRFHSWKSTSSICNETPLEIRWRTSAELLGYEYRNLGSAAQNFLTFTNSSRRLRIADKTRTSVAVSRSSCSAKLKPSSAVIGFSRMRCNYCAAWMPSTRYWTVLFLWGCRRSSIWAICQLWINAT